MDGTGGCNGRDELDRPEDAMDGTSFTVVDVLGRSHSVTASGGVTMIMSLSPVVHRKYKSTAIL
ncbi:hypothetical protein Bca4012_026867 [Brassica carinata]